MATVLSKENLITVIIALTVSLGVPLSGTVLDDELGDYYICDLDERAVEFNGGISGTAYSGYPFVDSRKSADRCGTTDNRGSWVKLREYAESVGLDPYDLVQAPQETSFAVSRGGGSKFTCTPDGCR